MFEIIIIYVFIILFGDFNLEVKIIIEIYHETRVTVHCIDKIIF